MDFCAALSDQLIHFQRDSLILDVDRLEGITVKADYSNPYRGHFRGFCLQLMLLLFHFATLHVILFLL